MIAIRCPTCQTRYRVPDEAGGKTTQCKKCGQRFRIPQPRPQIPGPNEELRLANLTELEKGEAVYKVSAPVPAHDPPPAVAMAPALPATEMPSQPDVPSHPYRDYLRSIIRSMAFLGRRDDAITALVLCLFLEIGDILAPFALCLGGLMQLVITGWYWSFLFNVVQDAAAGKEDLPTLALTGGWWDDIIAPCLKITLTTALVALPALAFLLVSGALVALAEAARGGGPLSFNAVVAHVSDARTLIVAGLLLLGGFFLWPMVILVVAVGGVGGLLRVDLMIRTILNSLPAYLIAVLAVYVCMLGQLIAAVTVDFLWGNSATVHTQLAVNAALVPIELYLTIVAMRAVGFYYHHFKHRFAWSWG